MLPVATRHRRDMTKKLLKSTLNPNKQQQQQQQQQHIYYNQILKYTCMYNRIPHPNKGLNREETRTRMTTTSIGRHIVKRRATRTAEPPHDKTNKMACAPSEDSDQPGHPPSLIRVFAVRMKKDLGLSYPLSALRRL